MHPSSKHYHKHHLKVLPYVLYYTSLLVLPIFKPLSAHKHKLAVHQPSSMAQLE